MGGNPFALKVTIVIITLFTLEFIILAVEYCHVVSMVVQIKF